jgi:hypothetical protein
MAHTNAKDIYRKLGRKIDGLPPVKQALMSDYLCSRILASLKRFVLRQQKAWLV